MTPSEKYEVARAELEEHEQKHYPLKDRYDASLAELQRLTLVAAEAWRAAKEAVSD